MDPEKINLIINNAVTNVVNEINKINNLEPSATEETNSPQRHRRQTHHMEEERASSSSTTTPVPSRPVHNWPAPSVTQSEKRSKKTSTSRRTKCSRYSKDVFCLPYTEENIIPIPRGKYRENLACMGLSGKVFLSRDMTHEHVKDEIASIFQGTSGVGDAFEFQILSVLPGSSKRLQKPKVSNNFMWGGNEVLSACGQGCLYIMCTEKYEDLKILEGAGGKRCKLNLEQDFDDSSDDELPEVIIDDNKTVLTEPVAAAASATQVASTSNMLPYQTYIDLVDDEDPPVILLSDEDDDGQIPTAATPPSTVTQEVMNASLDAWRNQQCLTQSEDDSPSTMCRVIVRRRHIKEDMLRAFKSPTLQQELPLVVKFVGESGVDTGGLTRELFTVGLPVLRDHYLFGEPGLMLPLNNATATSNGTFETIGRVFGAAVLHGRETLQFLNPVIAELLIGKEKPKLLINWIPQDKTKDILLKVNDATTAEELQNLSMVPSLDDVQSEICWNKSLHLTNKAEFVESALKHYLIFKQKAQIDELIKGMDFYGMKNYAQSFPDCVRSIFNINTKLDANTVFDIFTILYSEHGTNKREREEETTMFFIGLLESCSEDAGFLLEDLLEFFSGARKIPLGGYAIKPTIAFHDEFLPVASTCALQLTLPRNCSSSKEFTDRIISSVKNGYGFGQI